VTELRLKTEHLYRAGKIVDALNAFIEAEIDLVHGGPRDADDCAGSNVWLCLLVGPVAALSG